MNNTISCIICTDILSSNSEIFVTQCGHLFHHHCLIHWLQQKHVCPQCRKRTTESSIHRVFVNFNTGNESFNSNDTDPIALKLQVDCLQSSIISKDHSLKHEKEKYKELHDKFTEMRKEYVVLEEKIRSHKSVQYGLQDQIKFFKNKAQENTKLKEEVKTLERKIKDMEQVQVALNGTENQLTDLIQRENNIESLALLSATLKCALIGAEEKKRVVAKKLSDVTYKNRELKNENEKLRSENIGLKKELEYLKTNHDKEKSYLKQKISEYDKKMSSRSSLDLTNTSLKRIMAESPINIDRIPKLSSQSVIDFTESASPSVPEQIKKIKESDSPYLQVKSNNLGFNAMINNMKRSTIAPSTITSSKMSQPSRQVLEEMKSSQYKKGMVYDGLGGSSKEDIFPESKSMKRHKSSSTISSSKFRKLSAQAGLGSTKLTKFFSQD